MKDYKGRNGAGKLKNKSVINKEKGRSRHFNQAMRNCDNGENSEYLPDQLPSKRSGQS